VEPTHEIRLRPEDVVWREVDDEVIVLDRRTWAYLSINDSGAALWPHVVEGTTKPALVRELVARFEVDEPTAADDVEAFVAKLREHDLLAPAT
jgi:hypothetical protein